MNTPKESVIIFPLAKTILHGNLCCSSKEQLQRSDHSLVIAANLPEYIKFRTDLFREIFIDDAWRKEKGFVSFALGMMIENYSPKTSN